MSKRKLLLADDSITIQKVVNLTFADEGIEVVAFGNGSAALENFTEVAPDLVLADVHMPGATGYEVCEQIRRTPGFEQTPVMLLVGSFEPFDETEAKRVGANDYLTKPFQSIKQLVSKVNALLEAREESNFELAADEFQDTIRYDEVPLEIAESIEEAKAAAPDEQKNALSFGFNDTGFDDEMIQARSGDIYNPDVPEAAPTGELDQSVLEDFAPVEESVAEQPHTFEAEPPASEVSSEAPYNDDLATGELEFPNAEWESPAVSETNEVAENSARGEYETPAMELEFDTVQPFASQEQAFVEEEQREPETEMREEPLDVFELDEQTVERQDADAPPAEEAEPETTAHHATIIDVEDVKPLISPFLEDDDFLLDIEPVAETTAGSAADTTEQTAVQEAAPENNQQTSTSLEKTNAGTLSNPGEMFFTPEVIDAIAQRVVERLSDKVIEKIAWEIVPDRFDLIVRKHMNDKDRD